MNNFLSLISYGNKGIYYRIYYNCNLVKVTKQFPTIVLICACIDMYMLISSLRKIILSWDVFLIHTELYTTKDNLSIAIRMLLQREYISMT